MVDEPGCRLPHGCLPSAIPSGRAATQRTNPPSPCRWLGSTWGHFFPPDHPVPKRRPVVLFSGRDLGTQRREPSRPAIDGKNRKVVWSRGSGQGPALAVPGFEFKSANRARMTGPAPTMSGRKTEPAALAEAGMAPGWKVFATHSGAPSRGRELRKRAGKQEGKDFPKIPLTPY